MSAPRRLRLELGRLLRSRLTWLAMLLTLLSPIAGLTVYRPVYSTSAAEYAASMQGMYLANPALAGGLIGAAVFAALTAWELDRVKRGGMEALTDAVVSPLSFAWTRLLAMLALSAIAQALTMLAWLPWTAYVLGAVFDVGSYCAFYLIFMFGALPLAILMSAAAYQITRRLELALLVCASFAALSLTLWSGHWQLCWLNPAVFDVSDDFSNRRLLASAAYLRLTWLAALAGVWGVSCLCLRRYGKGLLGSLLRNARRAYRPVLAAALLLCAGLLYAGQPFLDHSEPELDYGFIMAEEPLDTVACSSRYADVRPDPATGRVRGTAVYQLLNTAGTGHDIQLRLNPGYTVTSVQANGADIPYALGEREAMNQRVLTVTLPADGEVELAVAYSGYPMEWNIGGMVMGDMEVSGVYMALENEVLAPTLYDVWPVGDTLPAIIDLTLPAQMTPVPFGLGAAEPLRDNGDGTTTWRVQDEGNSSIIFAGDYIQEDIPAEDAGLTVQFYYARKHRAAMEAADAAGAVRQVVEYCTQHIGPLYFYGDGIFKLIENRGGGGGYAANGASLANELDFTARNLGNASKGGAPAQVMIHELVHQWWGLGNMFDPADEDGAWSAEGLTCYTTYRIVKALYGEETARREFIARWQAEVDDYYQDFYVRHPEYLSVLPEQYQADIANSLHTVRQYSEMPLKILRAEELVGGEEVMDEILSGLFSRELDPMYPYLTYQEFLDACGLTEEALELG